MAQTALDDMDAKGAFKRVDSTFRDWVGKDVPAETGRYHLYISYACPWANRCLSTIALKGLDDVISVSVVHPVWQKTKPDEDNHVGWVFVDPTDPPLANQDGHGSFSCQGCIPDTINNCKTVRHLYDVSIKHKENIPTKKFTVPILWDKKTQSIVNNESSEIIQMINDEFNEFAKNPDVDLYPKEYKTEIDAVNEWIYNDINNGVYKCGFSHTQEAYDEAITALAKGMDRVEDILSRQRFIAGPVFTHADNRLFQTLVRFDEVYVVYFKCNVRRVGEYPNMLNYCREIYQMRDMKRTIEMNHIKRHYFASHPTLNPYAIVPRGPNFLADLEKPHNRNRQSDRKAGRGKCAVM